MFGYINNDNEYVIANHFWHQVGEVRIVWGCANNMEPRFPLKTTLKNKTGNTRGGGTTQYLKPPPLLYQSLQFLPKLTEVLAGSQSGTTTVNKSSEVSPFPKLTVFDHNTIKPRGAAFCNKSSETLNGG